MILLSRQSDEHMALNGRLIGQQRTAGVPLFYVYMRDQRDLSIRDRFVSLGFAQYRRIRSYDRCTPTPCVRLEP